MNKVNVHSQSHLWTIASINNFSIGSGITQNTVPLWPLKLQTLRLAQNQSQYQVVNCITPILILYKNQDPITRGTSHLDLMDLLRFTGSLYAILEWILLI